jgi:hypothetical protein
MHPTSVSVPSSPLSSDQTDTASPVLKCLSSENENSGDQVQPRARVTDEEIPTDPCTKSDTDSVTERQLTKRKYSAEGGDGSGINYIESDDSTENTDDEESSAKRLKGMENVQGKIGEKVYATTSQR